MRCRLAHIVTLAAMCLCAEKSSIHAQTSDATAPPDIRNEAPCQTSSVPDDEQPSKPEFSIAEVTFSGASQISIADQDQIATEVKRRVRGASLNGVIDEAVESAKAGWQNQGFFKVQARGEATILASSPAAQSIAVSVHVDEGPQYRLGGITFRNNKVISDLKLLRGLFPIKDGEIFSREQIAEGLDNLREKYQEVGYINFTSVPDTKFDEEANLISVDIDVDEGKQFHLGGVKVLGLDEAVQRELLAEFPMKRGQIYNGKLFGQFLLEHASPFPSPARYDRKLNERAGTIAFTFDFRPCPR